MLFVFYGLCCARGLCATPLATPRVFGHGRRTRRTCLCGESIELSDLLEQLTVQGQSAVASFTVQTAKSIAVLPFVDMSQNQDQEWFADGLSEEILNALTRVPDLLVTSRTSAFSYKGTEKNVPTIAQELGVANILEGSNIHSPIMPFNNILFIHHNALINCHRG